MCGGVAGDRDRAWPDGQGRDRGAAGGSTFDKQAAIRFFVGYIIRFRLTFVDYVNKQYALLQIILTKILFCHF
jgi:hypothetical protein